MVNTNKGNIDDVTSSFEMQGRTTLAPDNLNVRGRAISPNRSDSGGDGLSPAISSRTSLSDDEEMASIKSEEYTVLDGVREMNQILVRQIETLRLKIKVDEDNNAAAREKLIKARDLELWAKEGEIIDLKESMTSRDLSIHNLTKASQEKDRIIQIKCEEIEEMKKTVEQTKMYASKLHKQWSRMKQDKGNLDKDQVYKEQNKEIARLTEELEILRSRLVTMEEELKRASEIIEQQSEKLSSMDAENVNIQAKFREELDKASKAMRQEVERMREVMHQNCEEMRSLREQNKEMHSDVRAIKELLKVSRTKGDQSESVMGLQFPITSPRPPYTKQTHGHSLAVLPKGPGMMTGGNLVDKSAARIGRSSLYREKSSFGTKSPTRTGNTTRVRTLSSQNEATEEDCPSARGSPDQSARSLSPLRHLKTDKLQISSQLTLNKPNTRPITPRNALPPVASVKEGVSNIIRQPSGRGGKSGIRKGSAVAKK